MPAWVMWLSIAILSFIVEALTAGLTTLWFGVSAVVLALLTAFLDGAIGNTAWFLLFQVVFFVGISALLLFLTKPISKKLVKTGETNALSIVGKRAVVLERINNIEGGGQIKLNGNIWTARSDGEEIIEKGEAVQVVRIEGVSAIVKIME